jgi:hypothetical protein
MRQDFRDWLGTTAMLCVFGSVIGLFGSFIYYEITDPTICPAGSALIQSHCVLIVAPLP